MKSQLQKGHWIDFIEILFMVVSIIVIKQLPQSRLLQQGSISKLIVESAHIIHIFISCNLLFDITVEIKLASIKLAFLKVAPFNLASVKSAPSKLAESKFEI